MSATLRLNCWIVGSDLKRNIFGVEIANTERICNLKDLIREKKKPAFDDIRVDALVLWKVSLLFQHDLAHKLEQLDRNLEESLLPTDYLYQNFPEPPQDNHLQIVIQRPPAAVINLNCLVLSDDPRHIFGVEIEATKTVGFLRKVIKDNKKPAFDGVDADDLVLWKVKLTKEDAYALDRIKPKISVSEELEPMTCLSDVFADGPEVDHVHIIVQRAAEVVRDTIFWNRPPSAAHTIPPTLLHPIFGTFKDDCENLEPTREDNSLCLALSEAMSGIFDNQSALVHEFNFILTKHKIYMQRTVINYTEFFHRRRPGGFWITLCNSRG